MQTLNLNNQHLVLHLEKGKFVLKTKEGLVLGTFDKSREAARFAFGNGADSVKYDYDLNQDR